MIHLDDSWFPYWLGDIHLGNMSNEIDENAYQEIMTIYRESGMPFIIFSGADQLDNLEKVEYRNEPR